MTCQESQSLLIRYVDDDLGTEDRLAVERHLAACCPCREDVEELQEVLALCDRALTPPPSGHRFEDLIGLLHAAPPVPLRQNSLWRDAFRMAIAAAMVLMLISTADFVVTQVRHVVRVAEQVIYAPMTPDEYGQGMIGWQKRIAWADFLVNNPAAPSNETTTKNAQPVASDTPSTTPKDNTSWISPRNPRIRLCRALFSDQKTDFVSYTG